MDVRMIGGDVRDYQETFEILDGLGWYERPITIDMTYDGTYGWHREAYYDAQTAMMYVCKDGIEDSEFTFDRVIVHESAHHAHLAPYIQEGASKWSNNARVMSCKPHQYWSNNVDMFKRIFHDVRNGYGSYNWREAVACVAEERIALGIEHDPIIYEIYEDLNGPQLP